ncbi:hypothetical protein [Cellulomonas edaphi]|uniref:Uncharacterized protein n=1 Tax=Cellulomonas edaphi TaxID=3053468 RepID=A0ABT7S9R7_9CELL|nr:hypothetical protein [Cellulomons edaphi]MDM7832346.1 hypothetical protein [Cellulomons edaphi]
MADDVLSWDLSDDPELGGGEVPALAAAPAPRPVSYAASESAARRREQFYAA